MRVVLDTNILISGIFWKGTPATILERWVNGEFEVLVSEPILTEYSRVLQEFERKKKGSDGLSRSWILFVAQNATLIEAKKRVKVCRDPNDDMFLECALAGRAKLIVSGDRDLLDVEEFMGVEILEARAFLARLKR